MPKEILSITLSKARLIIDSIIDIAKKDGGKPVAVTVVVAVSRIIAFAAMDGVVPASIKLSQSKAYSSVIDQTDTILWASIPKQTEVVDFDMRNWTDENFSGFTGGVVIKSGDTIIGGIGVSGRRGKKGNDDVIMQDNELAEYGKSGLKF